MTLQVMAKWVGFLRYRLRQTVSGPHATGTGEIGQVLTLQVLVKWVMY